MSFAQPWRHGGARWRYPAASRAARRLRRLALHATPWALVAAVSVAIVISGRTITIRTVAIGGLVVLATWMVASARYERTLAVLVIYLGLFDGFLKLKTGSRLATLGRDVLLYSIVLGAVIRVCISRTPRLRLPPFIGWVGALVALAAIEIFNPGTGGISRGLAAVRPHVEFVPLFFLGWIAMRNRQRLRGFLFLLLLVAAINGAVGLVQLNLTPQQFAKWGPGYSADINGTNGVAARVFYDSTGHSHVRPFGLGADAGSGGIVGALACGAALALLLTGRRGTRAAEIPLLVVLAVGTVAAVVTSQTRVAVAGAAIALVSFAGLSVVRIEGRRLVALMSGLGLAAAIAVVVVNRIEATTPSSVGSLRYASIAPNRILATTIEHKGGALSQLPSLAFHYPLGAGLGRVGPAYGFDHGPGQTDPLDGETEPDFLMVELGIPGVIFFYGLQLSLMIASVVVIRRVRDAELRLLLAAVAAPVFALFVMGVSGPVSSGAPASPYYWFAAGTLSYWVWYSRVNRVRRRGRRSPARSPRVEALSQPLPAA